MQSTQAAQIELDGVTHAYRLADGLLPVLENVSFGIQKFGFTAVVGPSGCGKSTLTRLIAGLIPPDAGEIRLAGEIVTSPRPTVGMAFQNPVMLEWRTVLGNIILPLEIVASSMPQAQREDRARELLELVSLQGFEDKRPSELSGGMRQRVSLCRALVHEPEVLILDEPFGALDAFTREDLWGIMHRLRRKKPFTCLLITHDLRESVFLSDDVIVLSDRPAKIQYSTSVDLGDERTLEDLYSSETTELLAVLRHQIEIAQRRAPAGNGAES
ncbi:MAG: ABC transporter ATP-binding protein [Rhodobacteraceae bacterium]|nr:ABC transporter ATP-binding protein [Paracoccaceae bacterium]